MSSVLSPIDSPIYSALADDPDLLEIIEMFVADNPQRIAALRIAGECQDWPAVERLAHQMKGAAGSYGFAGITPVAARLERAARDRQPEKAILEDLEELTKLCRRLCASPASATKEEQS